MTVKKFPRMLSLLSAVCLGGSVARAQEAAPSAHAVFTMTDASDGNVVLSFARATDGSLSPAGSFATGGLGSGAGEATLGSQGSLLLSPNGRFLFAVNAGSNEVSSFRVNGAALTLVSHVSSAGTLPVSVTERDGLLYVLNAGGAGNVAGFSVDAQGALSAIPNAVTSLSAGASGPAQVAFDPWGETLVVSEKNSQTLDVFHVRGDGVASPPTTVRSSGNGPFGFAFTPTGVLAVSDAAGGIKQASAVSTYLDFFGLTFPVAGSVGNGQTAACWLVTTADGREAFVANSASGTISTYAVGEFGALNVVDAAAATLPGGKPLDLALSRHDRFLYALDGTNHAIAGFTRGTNGKLSSLGALAAPLPATAVGLAAK